MSTHTTTQAKQLALNNHVPDRVHMFQRKCACGNHMVPGGECVVCSKKQELLQRQATATADAAVAPPIVHEVLSSPGQPLDAPKWAVFEPHFERNFGDVRVHTDVRTAESARAVNAFAYTVERDVVFGTGQCAPHTKGGKRLLTHELTHTVQRRSLTVAFPNQLEIAATADAAEQEAERTSDTVEPASLTVPTPRATIKLARQQADANAAPVDHGQSGSTEVPEREAGSASSSLGQADGGMAPTPPAAGDGSAQGSGCVPTSLSRHQFLAQAGTGLSEFGLTTLEIPQVTFPAVRLLGRNSPLQATTAALPTIRSIFVGAGTFIDPNDTVRVFGQEGSHCRTGVYPRRWTITPGGAQKIRDGEQEHCDDFQWAFDISLRHYRDAVNRLAASGRRFVSEDAAKRHLARTVHVHPDDWRSVFICLANQTLARDHRRQGWHTPRARHTDLDPACRHVNAIVDENSLRQVGQHPSSQIIQGCGESSANPAPAPEGRHREGGP